jgi:hypothetical protein
VGGVGEEEEGLRRVGCGADIEKWDWLTMIGAPHPFYASAHSKVRLSGLFCYTFISVDSTGLTDCPKIVHFWWFVPLGVQFGGDLFYHAWERGKPRRLKPVLQKNASWKLAVRKCTIT